MMNCKILKIFLTIFLNLSPLAVWGQLLPTKLEVDSIFDAKCREGNYLSASAYIVECSAKREQIGDKATALEYRLKNCDLYDEHIDYFREKGLTVDDYLFNWELVSFLYRDLGNIDECVSIYLDVIKQMSKLAPDMLSTYSRIIATSLNDYTGEYRDSIYSLSVAMDYIAHNNFSQNDIGDFVWMANCFNWNRFYNSFKNNVRCSDRIFECDSWFKKYKWFIDGLDKSTFKDEIVRYYVQHTDMLYLLASSLASQENRFEESIFLLKEGIEYLDEIKELNDTLPIKIASFYSELAYNYNLLGDKPRFKECCDKANELLVHSKTYNLDYCSVLSQLSLNYWYLGMPKTAAMLKMAEIGMREGTSIPATCSDYAIFMMYNSNDTLSNIIHGKELEKKYGKTNSSMASIYMYMASAFSQKMCLAIHNNNEDSTLYYNNLYQEYIGKAKEVIEIHKNYLDEYGFTQDLLGSIYEVESAHYAIQNKLNDSYLYCKKALDIRKTKSYFDISFKSAAIHDKEGMHQYIPIYFEEMTTDLRGMLPLLGSVESGVYLRYGAHPLYRIPELAQWNPTDSVCASVAYDASLIMKGLYLNYSSFASVIGNNKELNKEYSILNTLKDSIYSIKDDITRFAALHDYEMRERQLRNKIIKDQLDPFFMSWRDVLNYMDDKEIAIEFVCYNKNNFSWIKDTICNHYIALLISKKMDYPLVVDLFDETNLFPVYDLQPKSYDSKEGLTLYHLLWGKLSPYLKKYDKVYFSPMGMLNLINIEALTDEKGISASKNFSLRRLSSTRQLIERKNINHISNITIFGAIDYKKSTTKLEFSLDSLNTRGNWSYLSGTKTEVENVKKACSSMPNTTIRSFTGAEATEAAFKTNISSTSSIIHIATHGFFIPEGKRANIPYYQNINNTLNIDDELFYSGLVFANGQESWNSSTFQLESNDGILTAYEISKMNLHKSSLVILSACETGIGNRTFDGIVGLERSFKIAGVRSIMMSLWKVDDLATSYMMINFYSELLKSGSIYSAFRTAQEIVREKYPDPYYWASFILLD